MKQKKFVWVGIVFLGALLAGALVFAANSFAAGGTGPADALLVTGETTTTDAHAQTWYKFDEEGHNQIVTATLDANGQTGIFFRVYTPDSIAQWISQNGLHPVGISARGVDHDQLWEGRFQMTGTYYLVVENINTYTAEYRLNVQGQGVTTVVNVVPTATPLPNPFATRVPEGTLNGGKIVFQEASGGKIYTVNADGTNLQNVTFGLDPAFSPDGSKIAFVRQGPIPGLYVVNADGTNERNLFGGTQVRSPSWVDENKIVYSSVSRVIAGTPICFFGLCFGGDDVTRWGLFDYNLADESIHDLNTPRTGGSVPSVNRVIGAIAFMNPELGLMLTPVKIDAEAHTINKDVSINTPTMSADGSRLTYMVRQPPAWQIVVAVWDGTNPTLRTQNDPLSFEHPDSVAPTFSPDGQEILYLSNRNGRWEFFAIGADGSNERQVLKNITDAVDIRYNYSAERVASWVK